MTVPTIGPDVSRFSNCAASDKAFGISQRQILNNTNETTGLTPLCRTLRPISRYDANRARAVFDAQMLAGARRESRRYRRRDTPESLGADGDESIACTRVEGANARGFRDRAARPRRDSFFHRFDKPWRARPPLTYGARNRCAQDFLVDAGNFLKTCCFALGRHQRAGVGAQKDAARPIPPNSGTVGCFAAESALKGAQVSEPVVLRGEIAAFVPGRARVVNE